MPTIDELLLEEWDLNSAKVGTIIKDVGFMDIDKSQRTMKVDAMRYLVQELKKLYDSDKKPTKKQFDKLFEKNEELMIKKLTEDFHDKDNKQDLFKVVKRKKSKNGVTLEFKRVSGKERMALIKSITEKLVNKLTTDQLKDMLTEGLLKNNNVENLKQIDKELDKKKPKIEGERGCYILKIGKYEVMTVG